MMIRIFKLLLLVMTVAGQLVGTEETTVDVDEQMKFLAIAQCEATYAHMCPSGLCSVESALNQTTEHNDGLTPAQFFCNDACRSDDGCRTICNCGDKRRGNINPFPGNSGQQRLSNPELHCREPTFISVKWNYTGNETKDEPLIFAIEIQVYGDQWKPYNLTLKNVTLIKGLVPRQKYRFRVFAVGTSGVIESPTVSQWISTLPPVSDFQSGLILLDPPSFLQQISPIKYSSDNASVRLNWKPGNDLACTYLLNWHVTEPNDGTLPNLYSKQISVTEDPMEVEIKDLLLDHTYVVWMKSSLPSHEVESSSTEMLSLVTKDCLDAFNYNLTVCLPPAPDKLNIRLDRISSNTAQILLSWTSVKGHPTGYNASLYDAKMRLIDTKLVPETVTLTSFNVCVPLETSYHAKVRAYSPAGLGKAAIKWKKVRSSDGNKISDSTAPVLQLPGLTSTSNDSSDSSSEKDTKTIVSVDRAETYDLFWVFLNTGVGGALFVVCCIFVTIRWRLCKWCLRKIPKLPQISQGIAMVRQDSNPGPESELEPESEPEPDVHLDKRIGEGAFGTVWLGRFSGSSGDLMQVAVKMLKENPRNDDIRNFDNEMSILKSANRHPNVIRLIRCLTQSPEKKMIMEYCKFGDLQRFLNVAWRELTKEPGEHLDHSNATSLSTFELHTYINSQAHANNTYEIALEVDREHFSGELISFARQIASGMEFLTDSGILHRDLAARNILIAEDRTIRISDFGLSREIFETSVYTKRGFERVPYKWVAPEAAKNKVFTTKSDVWSYGITLWEIVTLGSAPYSFISDVSSYLQYLLSGERMPQPCNCSSNLYEWMLRCWNMEPEGRPTFQLLREYMENLERSRELHISLDRDKISSFCCMQPSHLKRTLDEDQTETDDCCSMKSSVSILDELEVLPRVASG